MHSALTFIRTKVFPPGNQHSHCRCCRYNSCHIHGCLALGLKCKGVLSTGILIRLVRHRPSWCRLNPEYSLLSSQLREQVINVRMVVSPLWREPYNIHGFILPTMIGYSSYTNCARRFRCEDNSVAFTNVQPHYYRVRQVEPCHQLARISQAL